MVLTWLQKCTPDYLKLSEVSKIQRKINRKSASFHKISGLCGVFITPQLCFIILQTDKCVSLAGPGTTPHFLCWCRLAGVGGDGDNLSNERGRHGGAATCLMNGTRSDEIAADIAP